MHTAASATLLIAAEFTVEHCIAEPVVEVLSLYTDSL